MSTRFSVNLNKFALLRNSRGTNKPALLDIAQRCLSSGVHGITVHPRIDQRHTTYQDVRDLSQLLKTHSTVELNVEGTPDPTFLDVVTQAKPEQCTLVPDTPDQLTSDHGWDVIQHEHTLRPVIQRLKDSGIRVSLFLDPSPEQTAPAKDVGADFIELYTETYAWAFETPEQQEVIDRFRRTADAALSVGLGLNAGHDLDLKNLGFFLDTIPEVSEVSIGHAVICESFTFTLEGTIARYLEIVNVDRVRR